MVIANSVLSVEKNRNSSGVQQRHVFRTFEAVVKLRTRVTYISKHASQNVMTLYVQGKSVKNYHFNMFSYWTVHLRRDRGVNDALKSSRVSETIESFEKLHLEDPTGVRDT